MCLRTGQKKPVMKFTSFAFFLFFLFQNQIIFSQPVSERIFIQTDRDQYSPGETVHFKGFVTSADSAGLSTQLFVELRDSLLQTLSVVCLPVIDGSASGSLPLPKEYKAGEFYLRAYTDLSFVLKEAYQFVRFFSTVNPVSGSRTGLQPVTMPLFFPEGGHLTAGAINHIIFRAPADFKGEIHNSSGETVTECKPISQGMGVLNLLAVAGEQYYCVWQSEGREIRTPLPMVTDQTVALHIRQRPDTLYFDIDNGGNRSLHLLKPKVQLLIGGEPAYLVELNMMTRDRFSYFIPLTGFQPAMAWIRVLDTEDRVLASRPLFISRNSQLNPEFLHLKKKSLEKRGENQLEVDLKDTTVSFFSIRITDEGFSEPDPIPGLLKTLLPPGFRDYPAVPASGEYWPLLDMALQTDAALKDDYLLQLDTLSLQRPSYLTLKGQVKKGKKVLAEKDILLGIRSPYTGKELYKLKTDADGRFELGELIFYGDAEIHVRLPNNSEEELSSSFTLIKPVPNSDSVFFLAFRQQAMALKAAFSEAGLSGNAAKAGTVRADSIVFAPGTITLEEVIVKSDNRLVARKRLEELEKKYVDGTNFSGYTASGETLDVLNDPRTAKFLDIFSYIGMNMRGVTLMTVRGDKQLFVQGRGTGGTNTMVTVFYLGNSKVDRDMLNGIRLDEVAVIKYIPMLGSEMGFPPAIAIFLKKPGDQGYWEKDRYQFIEQKLTGYSLTKDFLEPDYSNPETKVESDNRKTLAWRPYEPADKGRTEIRFYNNDYTQKARIVITALGADGSIYYTDRKME